MKNSKLIVVLLLIIGSTQTALCQSNSSDSNLQIGIKGGVNFTNLYTDNVESNNVLIGYNVGLFAKLPLSNTFAIQPELLFTTKGSELNYNNAFVNGTSTFKLNYIEVPVLLVINLNKNFNIHAGPYVAYLVDGKATNNSQGTLFDIERNLSNSDYNQFDTGISLGVGFDANPISLGVRYNYGMDKVGKERNFSGTNYTFPNGKNSVLNLYISYSIL